MGALTQSSRSEPTTDPIVVRRSRQLGVLFFVVTALYLWALLGLDSMRDVSAVSIAFAVSFAVVGNIVSTGRERLNGEAAAWEPTELTGLVAVFVGGAAGLLTAVVATSVLQFVLPPRPTHLVRGVERLMWSKLIAGVMFAIGPPTFAAVVLDAELMRGDTSTWIGWPVVVLALLALGIGTIPTAVMVASIGNHLQHGRFLPDAGEALPATWTSTLQGMALLPVGVLIGFAWWSSRPLGAGVALLVLAYLRLRGREIVVRRVHDGIVGLLTSGRREDSDQFLESVREVTESLMPMLDVSFASERVDGPNVASFAMGPGTALWLVAHARPGAGQWLRAEDRLLLNAICQTAGSHAATIDAALAADRRASTDALTGLLNRTGLTEAVQNVRQASPDEPLAVVFLDLDHFKPINDTFGHEAGDEVLRHVAQRLLAAVRSGDVVSRLGGDEFVVVLRQCGDQSEVAARTMRVLESLRRPLALAAVPDPVRVEASAGAVLTPASRTDQFDSVLVQADAAMYRSKKSGQVEVANFNSPADRRTLSVPLRDASPGLG